MAKTTGGPAAQGATFQVGDTVTLRSGGPVMTVSITPNAITGAGQYACHWFAGKKLERGIFQPEELQAMEPPSPIPPPAGAAS